MIRSFVMLVDRCLYFLILCTVKTCTGRITCVHKVANKSWIQSIFFKAITSTQHAVAYMPCRNVYVK